MVGDMPDAGLFGESVGSVIRNSRRGREQATVHAYGEMVDLLWRDGNPDAAILLEDLWNDLAATERFTLMCGYGMGNFDREAHAIQFEEICRRHRRVIPTERWQRGTGEAAQLREICLLQQRAQALETEVVHRRGLERTLREALAERERAEAERERLLALEQTARADAEAAGRLKDEFLAVLSHELRTPLNAILGWTQIALDPRTDSQTVRRALEIIQRNAALQRHVVEDLLDLSRILTGKLRVSAEPVDLSEILTAAVDTVRPAAVAKTIELNLDVSRPVSDVMGDKDRLQQVMWNLLSNAVKFTPNNGRVDVRLDQQNAPAEIVVDDSGEGILADFLPHVFDRFRQADTGSTRKHGGLGLGLAVVRYLVEAHGGTVRAESAGAGRGATFVVCLPIFNSLAPAN
jgi:signal transduction histidine kinase